MTERKKSPETTPPDRPVNNTTTGHASGGRSGAHHQNDPVQSRRLTYELVRATMNTRQAALLERKSLPPITKQMDCKLPLFVLICFGV